MRTYKILLLIIWLSFGLTSLTAEQPATQGYEERRNKQGVLQYSAIDSNDDGVLDTFYYYDNNGKLERQEIDSNHDGKIDIIIYYIDGVYISRIERDIDGDGSFREKKVF
ncbi:hypothetical protein PVA45_03350 [Entomospira entomophila]|uniref:YD repeat-containing protein n=1 Tax=Entomospira entomophila TaxID=2719988 RepID=A0A968GDR0_9SPIO|nr:hypothetical protein [Entomospira entomophilus]NIZ40549.1 hypothetical protein [Entomospira entomophilus]WDI36107.1 hypothetical protein PVA45_03350 [Entomospira entomophilus]